MLKYTEYDITFSEIPGEVNLCINLSNCPYNCKNCHTPELKENVGKRLDMKVINKLIAKYPNITCICFMGGDKTPKELWILAHYIQTEYDDIKVAWYSGRRELEQEYSRCSFCSIFNYIKLGPYIEELGPLNNPNTNQRLYKIDSGQFIDITHKFWK